MSDHSSVLEPETHGGRGSQSVRGLPAEPTSYEPNSQPPVSILPPVPGHWLEKQGVRVPQRPTLHLLICVSHCGEQVEIEPPDPLCHLRAALHDSNLPCFPYRISL